MKDFTILTKGSNTYPISLPAIPFVAGKILNTSGKIKYKIISIAPHLINFKTQANNCSSLSEERY